MKTVLTTLVAFAAVAFVGAQDSPSLIQGTVKKIDRTAKTVVVAVQNGAEQTIHFADKTVVHGTATVAKDAFHGLKEGTDVVVHYTTKGAEKTAVEIDNVGKDGLKSAEGTISKIDAGTKKVVVKTADGAEQVFDMTAEAAADAAKSTATGAQKAGKATVYYTEEGGKKIVHFLKKVS